MSVYKNLSYFVNVEVCAGRVAQVINVQVISKMKIISHGKSIEVIRHVRK
jgi:hypothetical protein